MTHCPYCYNQLGEPGRPCARMRCQELAEAARAVGDTTYREAQEIAGRYHAPQDPATAETYWPEGHPPFVPVLKPIYPHEALGDLAEEFCRDVLAEVRKARAKFPGNGSYVTGLALGEESGEAQRALLHIREGKGNERGLYLECVQTAAMALRLALESEDRREWKGNIAEAAPYLREGITKRGCGGSYEIGSGGHVPGTPGEGCAACDRDFGPVARRAD